MWSEARYKVLFIIPNLGGGGAEGVMVRLLSTLSRERFEASLALFEKRGIYLGKVPDDVPVLDLRKQSRYSFLGLQWRISRLVKKNHVDAVVSFIDYANYAALMSRSLFRWHAPVIISERNTLSPSLRHQRFSWLKGRMMRALYPRADRIVAISNGCKDDLVQSFAAPREMIRVIHNPLDIEFVRAMAREPLGCMDSTVPQIIAVGRLTAQKDLRTLLKAFRLVRRNADVHLTVLGEGEERSGLEGLSRDLRIDRYVSFTGFVKNPYNYMARSKLLVLSSAWEGFPNVIIEAMACGTPVIATDCPSGPREMIQDGVNGLLVPVGDESSLAEAILRLIEDEALREKLARGGTERVQAFRVDKIVREYEDLLKEVIRRYEDESSGVRVHSSRRQAREES